MSTTEERSNPSPNEGTDSIPDDLLPPVEAPNAGFILQLFVIPLIIVAIIILVFFFLNHMAHMGSSLNGTVRKLKKGDDAAWQQAVNLTHMMRDPKNEHLKHNSSLCLDLADVLKGSIREASTQEHKIKLRIFLCKLLGEFLVDDGLPALKMAAETERDGGEIEPYDPKTQRTLREIDVRRTALEAIALLMQNVGIEKFRQDSDLHEILFSATLESGDPQRDEHLRRKVRSAATFALGVLGGQEALDRLELLLGDPFANARYNAAIGLARHGDERAIGKADEPDAAVAGLLEMLDPNNQEVTKDEIYQIGFTYKRELVLVNAIRASVKLHKKNAAADLSDLQTAIENLVDADVPVSVKNEARKGLLSLRKRQQPVP